MESKGNPTDHYVTDSVISSDGTTIGYRKFGNGPVVVLVHGGMESAQSYMQLGEALADDFTVCIPDRRGRGLSGPHGKDYSIQKEVEDLGALLTKEGDAFLFGVSSGALISLQAGLGLSSVQKVAAYEPPLYEPIEGKSWDKVLARYEKEIAEGERIKALVTILKGLKMGPFIFNFIPRRILESLMNKMVDGEGAENEITLTELVPTMHYDFQLEGEPKDFKNMPVEILLLGGSKSPNYLKESIRDMKKVLPRAKCIEFSGLNHLGAGNADQGGKPERVAQELRRFFV